MASNKVINTNDRSRGRYLFILNLFSDVHWMTACHQSQALVWTAGNVEVLVSARGLSLLKSS